ncbi:MAG: hypothetical protein EZS28_003797 [Streblomastix strix]|uniref:Uncharacterized protein n=1 Tax=Streblomastix strix TaxID=222440 RepID=A0A5J4X0L3_9EUKA|nr:MAG: hypothetical protein EZS28_003797 [Streblomastix strix]
MENQIYDGVSNRQINIHYHYDIYIINNCTFSNCYTTQNGGALSVQVSNGSSINIIDCTFTNCTSIANGGAIRLDISAGSTSTFEGLIKFKNCTGNVGGALYTVISGINSKLTINQIQFEDCQSSNKGGGMYLLSQLQAHVYIEQLSFTNCSSVSRGGGTHIVSDSKGYIQINQITAEDCKCIKGNGGGIYVSIDFGASSEFKMVNISLFRCKALADTTKDIPPTGYGGGIFLTGYGDYDSLSKMLDFRKMKIYNNTADKAGQSLYVAMTKVVDWSRRGTAGEYVKGNNTDGISNLNELQGIPVDSATFNSYSTGTINQQQNYLKDYWNAGRNEYYVKSTGNDAQQCTLSNPCKTLNASVIISNINSINAYFVYIYDSTSITNTLAIQIALTPRTFRNYPLDSTQLSSILFISPGVFNCFGKARFQLINFIMENTGYQDLPGIYGLAIWAEIDLHDCQFHMQNAGSLIGRSLIRLNYSDNHIISNLNSKDISSYDNIITINFFTTGSVLITDSQFENITKIGNTVIGGAIKAVLYFQSNKLDISNCKFTACQAQDTNGGAIYTLISNSNAQFTLTRTQFLQCQAKSGGGLCAIITLAGQITIENSCEFKECNANSGNGGGIYAEIPNMQDSSSSFVIRDALIQNCQAVTPVSATNLSGFGGGIFIGQYGDYNPSTQKLNLKGMKIYNNSASSGGQSLFVIMNKLEDWCEYGLLGEYVKGNYSDTNSNENDLQGFIKDFLFISLSSKQSIISNQKTLENYWRTAIPSYSIWHVQQRFGSQNGTDALNCGQTNQPCKTIEYAIRQISLNIGGSETQVIEEKNIGISQYGYDLLSPIQLNKSGSHTDAIKIMKQMYGTPLEMSGNTEFKIIKNNDNNKENGKLGWISVFEGLQLHLYGLNIIMDNSQLLIPIIYIQDSKSLLELNSNTFSGIKLSPTTESKGIIHIKYDNSQFIASNCTFSNIQIQLKGGNAIRILNNGSQPITATIKGCQFNNINSIGDSNGRGGSAIYMENKHGSKVIIEDSCQFYKCIIDKGNGGAIYIDIDFTSEFIFNIKDALIKECQAITDTSKDLPPTGYGGGIFLTGSGEYNPSSQKLNLKGMKIYNNSASSGGQSLYVAMTKLKEWCIIGNAGEYVKGNYSDGISNLNELQGIPIDQQSFNILQNEQIQIQQRALEYYWNVRNSIYHIQNRNGGQYYGQDQQWCGNWDEACLTIQYAIDLISIKQGSSITKVDQKNIGINQLGYDLQSPIQLNKSDCHTDVIKIMKQMYGTPSEMSGNAEMKILKNNDDNKENGKLGWISVFEGLQLHLYGLNIIMDNSQLLIPIIYIQDSKSLLELNSNTFSGIKLSPTTESKGIIHIKYDNSQFIASNCTFSNIQIQLKGGNAIRILNNGSQPITATIKGCQFNNINSIGDSNGRGGSAIYMENKHGSKVIIEDSCQFYKCIIDKGNGGAIYIDIDFTSEFIFNIKDALIKECQAITDTSKDLPPTGYGGGIFLTGSGDYDPSSQKLNLKGMKIYNNSASSGGQSLYVIMSRLIEWCQFGMLGEYTKGNYSDRFSQFEDLEGIPNNQSSFDILSLESIQQIQSALQFYWMQISNLTKASATLNISNINQTLLINLEGYNMIKGQFAVKIVEQGQISYNYAFEIIYPPDDGSSKPILIEGVPHSLQTASFGMNDISWLDYDNKHYGVFVSNDKRIFSGIEGKQDEAYPLEIIIEEDDIEQEKDDVDKTTHISWWIILIIKEQRREKY